MPQMTTSVDAAQVIGRVGGDAIERGAGGRVDNGDAHEDKIEPPVAARNGATPGVDVAAIKRELRAVLDQLRG